MLQLSLLIILALAQLCSSTNPGVKVRLTKNGLGFVNEVVQDEIAQRLKTLVIPDQSGNEKHLEYSLTNIRIKSVTSPGSSLSLVPEKNGVTWSLTNFDISLSADWRAKLKEGFIHISSHGSVDVSLSGINGAETAAFSVDKTGRPAISSKGCSMSIHDVDIKFHGGAAIILNLFHSLVDKKVKEILPGKICDEVEKLVNEDVEKSLSTMAITVEIAKKFILDYRLVSAPSITEDYIEILDKGEVFWEANQTSSPFTPEVIPEWKNNSRMIYIWVTEFTPNTFLYQAQKFDFLKYNVTKKDLPPQYASYLDTTCQLNCVGAFIPQIGKVCPNSSLDLHFRSSSVPKVSASSKGIKVALTANVPMSAQNPDHKDIHLLTLGVNISLTLDAAIQTNKLSAKITDQYVHLTVKDSAIGNISPDLLNLVMDSILNVVIVPKINDKLGKGIELPIVKGVQFIKAELILQEGDIVIGTDLQLNSKPLHYESEKTTAS